MIWRKKPKSKRRRPHRRLHLERLENRELLAGLADVGPPAVVTIEAGNDQLLQWHVDVDGDARADREFTFGWNLNNGGRGKDVPLIGDIDHDGDLNAVIVRPQSNGLLRWYVDTDGDPTAEYSFEFGFNTDTPLIADLNDDGKDDAVVVRKQGNGMLRWYYDINRNKWADGFFDYGWNTDLPLLADIDNDGTVNPIVVRQWGNSNYWFVDKDRDPAAELGFRYGVTSGVPVVSDADGNGTLDVGVVHRACGQLYWMGERCLDHV